MKKVFLLFFVISTSLASGIENKKIYLIGSIHDLHKSHTFTEEKFNKLLRSIKPELIFLEFPMDWFGLDNLPDSSTKIFLEDETNKDGGRDGQLAWKYCKENGVQCSPFDIVGRNKFFKENQVFKRLDEFEKELITYVESKPSLKLAYANTQYLVNLCKDQSPEVLNGLVCDQAMRGNEDLIFEIYKEAKSEKKLKDPMFYQLQKDYWDLRNKTMAENICTTVGKLSKKRFVVITGVDHHYYLKDLLKSCKHAELTEW